MRLFFWAGFKVGAWKGQDLEDRLMVWREAFPSGKKYVVLVSAQGTVKGAWTLTAWTVGPVRNNWLGENWRQTSWHTPRTLNRSRGAWGWDDFYWGFMEDEFANRAYWAARNFLTSLGNVIS